MDCKFQRENLVFIRLGIPCAYKLFNIKLQFAVMYTNDPFQNEIKNKSNFKIQEIVVVVVVVVVIVELKDY